MELKPPDGCAMDGHDYICPTCSGKTRKDLLDRAEVVEALALRVNNLHALGNHVASALRLGELEFVCCDLGIWPAVEQRAKEMEEER